MAVQPLHTEQEIEHVYMMQMPLFLLSIHELSLNDYIEKIP